MGVKSVITLKVPEPFVGLKVAVLPEVLLLIVLPAVLPAVACAIPALYKRLFAAKLLVLAGTYTHDPVKCSVVFVT